MGFAKQANVDGGRAPRRRLGAATAATLALWLHFPSLVLAADGRLDLVTNAGVCLADGAGDFSCTPRDWGTGPVALRSTADGAAELFVGQEAGPLRRCAGFGPPRTSASRSRTTTCEASPRSSLPG